MTSFINIRDFKTIINKLVALIVFNSYNTIISKLV